MHLTRNVRIVIERRKANGSSLWNIPMTELTTQQKEELIAEMKKEGKV